MHSLSISNRRALQIVLFDEALESMRSFRSGCDLGRGFDGDEFRTEMQAIPRNRGDPERLLVVFWLCVTLHLAVVSGIIYLWQSRG